LENSRVISISIFPSSPSIYSTRVPSFRFSFTSDTRAHTHRAPHDAYQMLLLSFLLLGPFCSLFWARTI
jgi:hypothetical protein